MSDEWIEDEKGDFYNIAHVEKIWVEKAISSTQWIILGDSESYDFILKRGYETREEAQQALSDMLSRCDKLKTEQ